ncbi:substrate-binding domain-containing protein [Amycolatopsis rhabdoformis]|uniref:Substrate-binding domain-containing protein n=1 Tax=Amycolatopsis rhabdoformis TaxID=1448059 RepID=A0ABZ1IIU1_9PSEU|nr:substrate-binding domain-containing protein [Amycolatopsis rhabdoformis]WSE34059.1 substrate-binding domain-containing protein [Amycolatopsis rhabdoformis]
MNTREGAGAWDRRLTIAVIEKNRGPYWDMVNAGWRDAAERWGLDLVFEAPEYESVDDQVQAMRRHLVDGADGLAFVATRESAFDEVVAEAAGRCVPVVTFDLDAPASGRALYVGMPTPVELGRQAGRLLAQRVPAGARVLAQTGSAKAPGAAGKLRGFREAMAEAGIEVVGGDDDGERLDVAAANVSTMLAEHPDIAGCYGVYGYHAAIQAAAVEAVGRTGQVAIVGNDMLPETAAAIRNGTVFASIWIREYYFGYYAAAAIAMAARMGTADALTLLGFDPVRFEDNQRRLRPQVITAENLEGFEQWAGEHDVFGRTAATTGR